MVRPVPILQGFLPRRRGPARLPVTVICLMAALAGVPLQAQDSLPMDQGVRVGIEYTPGVRPRLVVLPGTGLDSVRAILERDLDYSDRFEMIYIDAAGSGSGATINYALYRTLGAQFALGLTPSGSATIVELHDLDGSAVRQRSTAVFPAEDDPGFRMAVHRLADEVVRWVTGTPGIAASQLLYVADKRLWKVDSDGHNNRPVTATGETILSPAWSPDGRRVAYTRFSDGSGTIQMLFLSGGTAVTVPGTREGLNYAAAFSPDGRSLAFTRSGEGGTDIFGVDVADMCCVRRLTASRFADNLSPTYSPDGRRLAFVSTRAGPPQIYAMSADGTDQELLASFDFGATGSSFAPEWSPDGSTVAFHRSVAGRFQVFVVDLVSRRVKQVTSAGRNEDATWAPDGRHLAFVSSRSGRSQLWIIDTETGRIRQLGTPSAVRLPSWSPHLHQAGSGFHQ